MKRRRQKMPEGWDDARIRRVVNHYEMQSEAEAIAEDEATCVATTHTPMRVPVEAAVRGLIACRARKGSPVARHLTRRSSRTAPRAAERQR